jgi:hypothetical protein
MREDVMWTWDYELRTLGSWPSERYNGHNMPVEVVTKADHDAALRRAKAEAKAEGLRQAKQYVERQIKIGEDLIGRPDPNIQRRVALDEIIEYCDEHIATLIDARAATREG